MPQTQFVLSQAIKNNLKLIIFINKVDRMFTGLSENIEDIEYKIKEITDKVECCVSLIIMMESYQL